MAARPESRNAPAMKELRRMPLAEGVEHLLAEVEIGLPKREVLVADPDLTVRLYPDLAGVPVHPCPPPLFAHGAIGSAVDNAEKAPALPAGDPRQAMPGLSAGPAPGDLCALRSADGGASACRRRGAWFGPACILGDNRDARALREELQRHGVQAYQLSSTASPEEAVAELSRLWEERPLPHLFITTARDAAATRIGERDVVAPGGRAA